MTIWTNYQLDLHMMMTSSNENIFRVTVHLWGESAGHCWISPTKASDAELPVMFSVTCAWTNGWANNRDAGDMRRHRTHYEVNEMMKSNALYRRQQNTCVKITDVSNHRPLDCLSHSGLRLRTKKTLKLRNIGPLWGESTTGRWISLTKGKNVSM